MESGSTTICFIGGVENREHQRQPAGFGRETRDNLAAPFSFAEKLFQKMGRADLTTVQEGKLQGRGALLRGSVSAHVESGGSPLRAYAVRPVTERNCIGRDAVSTRTRATHRARPLRLGNPPSRQGDLHPPRASPAPQTTACGRNSPFPETGPHESRSRGAAPASGRQVADPEQETTKRSVGDHRERTNRAHHERKTVIATRKVTPDHHNGRTRRHARSDLPRQDSAHDGRRNPYAQVVRTRSSVSVRRQGAFYL